MATFLDTQGIFSELNSMIKNANDFIVIVSPYISFDAEQLVLLKNASENGVPITFFYRLENQNKNTEIELKKVSMFPEVKIIGCPDLHAKIYANEEMAILTSHNLSIRQKGSSIEVGVSYNCDEDIYEEIMDLVKRIAQIVDAKIITNNREEKKDPFIGFCIRCGKEIPLDIGTPFCKSCYNDWKVLKNKLAKETYCHFCGQKAANISFSNPMEYACFHKYNKLQSKLPAHFFDI